MKRNAPATHAEVAGTGMHVQTYKPRYEFKCCGRNCGYLGQYKEYDLYFCGNKPRFRGVSEDTLEAVRWQIGDIEHCMGFQVALVQALRMPLFKAQVIMMFENSLLKRHFSELLLIAECDPINYVTLLTDVKLMGGYLEYAIQQTQIPS